MRASALASLRTAMAILALAVSASLARAQASPTAASSPAPRLDASKRRAVVDTLGERLRRHYIDADTGAMIADRVRARLTAGAYDTITSPARFAEALTVDLRSVNGRSEERRVGKECRARRQ